MNGKTRGIIAKVHKLLTARGLSLSVAESCTGGLLSHYCTLLPGSSHFFRGGVVAYSNEAKKDILGVPPDILEKFGAVSSQCALEMARRGKALFGSDISISTTGNLGPEVLEGKGVGLIHIALAGKIERARELHLQGTREENNEETVYEALKLLEEYIK